MNCLVLGLQWGDEGKGKAIDYLAPQYDVVVRYQGGHNAGHTIYLGDRKFVLHLLPSGVFSPTTYSVIGSSVVVHPLHLLSEIQEALPFGLNREHLFISESAPLILPFHQELDIVFEESRHTKIGTTRRGIGPAYEDLAGRRAVFIRDLLDKDRFYRQVKPLHEYSNRIIRLFGGNPVEMESYIGDYVEAGRELAPLITDTTYLLNRLASENKKILFEGAQGSLLDVTLGTYPFVTASHPTVGGVLIGTGLSHKALHKVVGISKAYTTRVGEGPFPTELTCDVGQALRKKGDEYGATTGRPRRVGWLDLVALKYAVMINGVDSLFLTKLDVLDELETIQAATAYEIDGRRIETFPHSIEELSRVIPVWRSFPGWRCDTGRIRQKNELPSPVRDYIGFMESYLKIPVEFLSVGSRRDQTLVL